MARSIGLDVADWRAVRRYARRQGARGIADDVVRAFQEHKLLTYASAVSFQAVFTLIPLVLAAVAVLGFLDLEAVWKERLAPQLRGAVSEAVYEVIDRSVDSVLGSRRGFWLTLGAGLALWELSGAVRAAMGALNEIYGAEERRSFVRRLATSLALAAALALLLGSAVVVLQVVPRLARAGDVGVFAPAAVVAAWLVAVLLMIAAIALTMRYAPAVPQSMGWLGFGTLLVVSGWGIASAAFAAYATRIASYSSVYGGLGVVILLLTYVYISSLVFLGAAQLDALVRGYARDAR